MSITARAIAIAVLTACALGLSAATGGAQTAGDSATGAGTYAQGAQIEFNATSGPEGDAAAGQVTFATTAGNVVTLMGTITCLHVVGNEATMAGEGTFTTSGVPETSFFRFGVRDNGVAGSPVPDEVTPIYRTAEATCTEDVFTGGTFFLDAGEITVVDSVVPPPPPPPPPPGDDEDDQGEDEDDQGEDENP